MIGLLLSTVVAEAGIRQKKKKKRREKRSGSTREQGPTASDRTEPRSDERARDSRRALNVSFLSYRDSCFRSSSIASTTTTASPRRPDIHVLTRRKWKNNAPFFRPLPFDTSSNKPAGGAFSDMLSSAVISVDKSEEAGEKKRECCFFKQTTRVLGRRRSPPHINSAQGRATQSARGREEEKEEEKKNGAEKRELSPRHAWARPARDGAALRRSQGRAWEEREKENPLGKNKSHGRTAAREQGARPTTRITQETLSPKTRMAKKS